MSPKVDSIDQLVDQLLELDSTGVIKSRTNISVNPTICGTIPEPMNLCSLFDKFSQDNYWELFKSLTAFPSDGVNPRFLVYYTGIYHCIQWNHVLTTVSIEEGTDGPSKSNLCVMRGENETAVISDSTKMNWFKETTGGVECKDLNGRVIDASMTLTDYRERGNFDVVEFSDYEYSISTIRVETNRVYGSGDWESVGNIGQFFGCDQTGYTTPPTTTSTRRSTRERSKLTKGTKEPGGTGLP